MNGKMLAIVEKLQATQQAKPLSWVREQILLHFSRSKCFASLCMENRSSHHIYKREWSTLFADRKKQKSPHGAPVKLTDALICTPYLLVYHARRQFRKASESIFSVSPYRLPKNGGFMPWLRRESRERERGRYAHAAYMTGKEPKKKRKLTLRL